MSNTAQPCAGQYNAAKDSTSMAILGYLSEVLKNYISSEELIHNAVSDFQAHCSYMFEKLEEDIRISAIAEAAAIVAEIKREKDAWEVEKSTIAATQRFESRIKLDVGGNRFTTSLATLRMFPDTMLGAMFSGRHALHPDKEGYHFIDRDGTHFRYILQFLRSPETFECELTGAALKELKNECDFYGLKDMMFPSKRIPPFVCYNSLAQPTRVTQDSAGVWCANNIVLKLCQHCSAAGYDASASEAENLSSFFGSSSSGGEFTFGNTSNSGFTFGSGGNSFGNNTYGFGNNNAAGFGNNNAAGGFGHGNAGFGSGGIGFGSNTTGSGFGSNHTNGFGNATAGFAGFGGFSSNTSSTSGVSAGFTFGSGTAVFGNGNTGVNDLTTSATAVGGNDGVGFTFGSGGTPGFNFGGNHTGFSFGNNTSGFGNSNGVGNTAAAGFTFGSNVATSVGTGTLGMLPHDNQRQFILNFRRIVEEKDGSVDFSVQPMLSEKCQICNCSPSLSVDDDM